MRFHNLDVRSGDLVDLVRHRQPEVIFHLAAQADVRVSVDRPVFDAEVNVLGTIQVLEGARAAAATTKVVFAASGGTLYGEPEGANLPVDEHQPHRPLSPYGVSKKAAIDYLVAYRELHGLEFTALALAKRLRTSTGPARRGRSRRDLRRQPCLGTPVRRLRRWQPDA